MGYPAKVQRITRKTSHQWFINFPAAVAQAMEFERGETVEWIIEDRGQLLLRRLHVPPSPRKNHAPSSRALRSPPKKLSMSRSVSSAALRIALARTGSEPSDPSVSGERPPRS